MSTNDLNKHEFRKPGENALAAGALIVRFGCCEPNEIVEQTIGRDCRPAPTSNEARQRIQQRIKWARVATKKTTDQVRVARTFAPGCQFERQRVFIGGTPMQLPVWFSPHAWFARQDMT